MNITREDIVVSVKELIQLRDEVVDRLYQMRELIRSIDSTRMIFERANSYWIPNTITNLIQGHEWLTRGSMVNFDDTIGELEDLMESVGDNDAEENQ